MQQKLSLKVVRFSCKNVRFLSLSSSFVMKNCKKYLYFIIDTHSTGGKYVGYKFTSKVL